MDWRDLAACRNMGNEIFFSPLPEEGRKRPRAHDIRPALAVCKNCPVTYDCLMTGLDEHFGIWGGLSERKRRLLRKDFERNGTPAPGYGY